MRLLRLLTLLALSSALALGLSACDSEEAAPPLGELLADSMVAVQEAGSAAYSLDLTVDAGLSAEADAQMRRLVEEPIELHVEGAAGKGALTAAGTASLMGQSFPFDLRAGSHELYLQVLGQWYGSKELGLAEVGEGVAGQAGQGEESLDKVDEAKVLAVLREHADEALDGDLSSEGDVWRFEGGLDADGLAALMEREGEQMTEEERRQLDVLAESLEVVLEIDKDGDLPRRLELSLDLDAEDVAALEGSAESADEAGPSAGAGPGEDLESLSVGLAADFSDWGEEPEIEAPEEYRPIEELAFLLLGLFGGLGGLGQGDALPGATSP